MGVIDKPGIYRMTAAEYHADPCVVPSLSSTVARILIDKSPKHAKWAMENGRADTAAFDIGRAAHRLVLGVGDEFTEYPASVLASNGAASTNAAKTFAKECRAVGITPLSADDFKLVHEMAKNTNDRLAEMGITLDPERSELVAIAFIDGVWCRAMIDNAPADPALPLYDFKTTIDAKPERCVKTVEKFEYDVQQAWYLDTWKGATDEDREFAFIFTEKEGPYDCSVIDLDRDPGSEADWMENARSGAVEARRLWRECTASGNWPGYPARRATIGAPNWHVRKWENRGLNRVTAPSYDARTAAYEAQKPNGEI